jgi:undecaprenyl diphosphate synthase
MENINLKHIAIIMDGNRRWAKKRNLPIAVGHRTGADTLQKIIEYCIDIKLKYLTVYAFSTENWKRSPEEVNDLMNLLREYLVKLEKDNKDRNAKIRIIGDINRLDEDLQEKIIRIQERTSQNTGLVINVALNYGSRDEIIHAIKSLSKDELESLDMEKFSEKLYTYPCPDPDLIIRTAGEQRLSNFLLWQAAYSEFWYTDVLWPDFSEKELDKAIEAYSKRNRKFGGK